MASLHKLLSEDGFQPKNSQKPTKKVKFRDRNTREDSITLPIYICHDRRSFDSSRNRAERARSVSGSSVFSNRRCGPGSDRAFKDDPAIDDVAIKAMVAILSGYVGQYLKDVGFRVNLREKCRSCFEKRRKKGLDSEILARFEMGIERIEQLVENSEMKREIDLDSLQKCIKILSVITSLDCTNLPNHSCLKTNSYLSACANLYLSIIYKIGRNDKISAKHLLQVFCDSPFLARTHLLPELWEHFFLPHLLHLKIWYNKKLDCVARLDEGERARKMRGLSHQYNEQMDVGTVQFALYYKEWLKVGAQAPSVPTVPLPSKSTRSRRKSSESSTSYHSSSSKLLYEAVFGTNMKKQSLDFDDQNGASRNAWDFEVEGNAEEDVKRCNYVEKKGVAHRRSSSLGYEMQKAELLPESQKSDYFRFLGCRTEPVECLTQRSYVSNTEKPKLEVDSFRFHLSDTDRAIATICSSESLTDCEAAIRVVSEAWLDGDSHLESSLSRASVIQGILEILYMSNDDEILELAVSILAEIADKNEANRQCVLTSDPQLVVSMRLMRSSSLFLKAAVLLYLVKPKAKQMVSMEWIPLVLRVLEFGDQLQALFTVRCSPHEAAYYFLNELLTGFDEDMNVENAKQIISLGGLGLLVRRMEAGDAYEKTKAAAVLRHCIRADGSCRHYLINNLKKDAILALMILENKANSQGNAIGLLSELLCVSRRSKRVEFLNRLKEGWNCLNTLQILLVRLQKARSEERPIIAVILLKLDLLNDRSECSVYREEAIDAIAEALDFWVFDEKIQLQAAIALFILGGHFSYTGEQDLDKWLLTRAGVKDYNFNTMNEDEETGENRERKAALVLLTNRKLLSALSDSMANSIPVLAKASLVTVCWISTYIEDENLRIAACSIFVQRLIECITDGCSNMEEKILASFSLYSLTKGTDYFSQQSRVEREFVGCLKKLCRATWTAKELISLISSSDRFL